MTNAEKVVQYFTIIMPEDKEQAESYAACGSEIAGGAK